MSFSRPSSPNESYYNARNTGRWTNREKDDLEKLVKLHGKNWNKIAESFSTRSARQIREHYQNHQNPLINKRRITRPESDYIKSMYCLFGSQWVKIAECLEQKFHEKYTGVMIRNHWNNNMRRLGRLQRSSTPSYVQTVSTPAGDAEGLEQIRKKMAISAILNP
ncbi:hypothetical protein Glove_303g92 [Diversispora epigaea]|uniref:Uncharacterized protein n=1 Tax=Diversispora epigaea TaxID=1348612 RepID=A0A397HW54_9GLOM|nr:hypothetical protein Glove_303g92 [Diversispora epigaea]